MKKPIRVLHVFGKLNMGGAESRTMDIYRNLDKDYVQFDFAIHTDEECYFSEEIRALGGKIYSIPRFNGKNYYQYKKAWSQLFENNKQYQIIHGHQTSTGFIYLSEAKKKKIPVRIAHARNSNKDTLLKKYLSKLAKYFATDLFAVSKMAAESEFGLKSIKNNKVEIIPNAIDVKKYIFDEDIRIKKKKELKVEGNINICHVGRFHPQKNHEFLLEVFKEIKKNNENVKLFLVGEGELEKLIENKISELGLGDSVVMTGTRSDIPEFLQAMDLLLFPSLFEGFPGVVLEAQASGLPCIISTNISEEVQITNLVKRIPLDKSMECWAKEVTISLNQISRKNTLNTIVEKGYDKSSVTEWYQNFYLKKYN